MPVTGLHAYTCKIGWLGGGLGQCRHPQLRTLLILPASTLLTFCNITTYDHRPQSYKYSSTSATTFYKIPSATLSTPSPHSFSDIVTSWSQTIKHATLDHYTHHFLSSSLVQMERFPQFDCLWDKAVLRLLWYWIVCSGLCITNNSLYSALLAWMVTGWLCFTSMIYPTWFFFLSRLHLDSKVLASLNLHQLLLQCFYC